MKVALGFAITATLAAAFATITGSGGALAQAMFRADAAHLGSYSAEAPAPFHRVKWKFPDGRPDRVVARLTRMA